MRVRTYSEQLDAARKAIVMRALRRHEGNKTRVAWDLRIDRNYVSRLVKKFGLENCR